MNMKKIVAVFTAFFMLFSIFTNASVGYAAMITNENNADESINYFLIHYDGEEQEVIISEHETLKLVGWTDELKTAVDGISVNATSNESKEVTLEVTDEISELEIAPEKSIYYRVIESNTFNVENVQPLTISEQSELVAENENGTSIETVKLIDEFGTTIEERGQIYYEVDENGQKVIITKEEYEALNSEQVNADEKVATSSKTNNEISNVEEDKAQVERAQSFQTFSVAPTSTKEGPTVSYKTHIQNIGWEKKYVHEGGISGTEKRALRLEAIDIKLDPGPYEGKIQYRTHVQNKGWLDFVSSGPSGTEGEALRLEAIEIKLEGAIAQHYDIYYSVHAQDFGWLDWAKNGEPAGTAGLTKRLEAIKIQLVKKGEPAPGPTKRPFTNTPTVSYTTHVQDYGWQSAVADGDLSGTVGKAKRLEAIKIQLKHSPFSGDIEYTTHVQDYGWLPKVSNGKNSGTIGEAKRLEAIQINLTGEMANRFDIYYRVHAQDYGWLDWAKNGESAGTAGLSKRLEAIEIKLVKKGESAPGSTQRPFVIDPSVVYSTHVQNKGWLPSVKDGAISGTTGEAKQVEAIRISLEKAPYAGGISYSTHVQDKGWLSQVSNGQISGTVGENKRVEAIQINLTGKMAEEYDIYYRVHISHYGWLGWAKNGMKAGSEGRSQQVESIQIQLFPKGEGPEASEEKSFIPKPKDQINYTYYNLTLSEAVTIQMNARPTPPQTDKYRNEPAYVAKDLIAFKDIISSNNVRIRTTPKLNTSSNIAYTVNQGTEITILGEVQGDSYQGSTKWYEIKYNNVEPLYVHSKLVDADVPVTKDKVKVQAAQSHSSHVFGELSKGTKVTIIKEVNGWYQISYGAWRNATRSDVEYYVNPNNFINDEKLKFQFLDLSKPTGATASELNNFLLDRGTLHGMGQAFIEAARLHGVNELYLISHAILETGHGTSELARGVQYNGRTVYNVYGIGAVDGNAVAGGAKTAYEKGWFTVEDAIIGGAEFIGNDYIKVGQNTLYKMRWNPAGMQKYNKATHQYATDIGWATKQLNNLYTLYKEIGIKNLNLDIPVYK